MRQPDTARLPPPEMPLPGDFLGEMGIVSQAVRNATVRTTSSGTVIVMTSQDFRAMQLSNPTVASQIEAAVEERCRALVG